MSSDEHLRVLVVEDDPDFVSLLRLLLEQELEARVDLSHLVTHRFTLDQWPQALETALNKGKHHAIKIAFTRRDLM